MILDSIRKVVRGTGRYVSYSLTLFLVTAIVSRLFFWPSASRRKRGAIDLFQIERVLVVRADEIGDMVMMTPFLRELRRLLPHAWITLVVKPEVRDLVDPSPYVDEVLIYQCEGWRHLGPLQRHFRALQMAYRHLWRRRFDLAVVPRWDVDNNDSTLVAYFSGASWRIGYSETVLAHKKRLNKGFDRLLTHVLDDNTLKHEVEHNLDVIRYLGGVVQEDRLELWLTSEDEANAEMVLRTHGVRSGDLLIAYGPGAGSVKRMWPLANFAELGMWLQRVYQARIVIVGGREERQLGAQLQEQLGDRATNTVGQMPLRQTSAVLKRCHLYVGNDTGLMHLAAAAGVPVIEFSCHPLGASELNSNSPRRFGPWGVPHRVLQPKTALDPCSDACTASEAHCILGVTVEQAREAVAAQLSRQGDSVMNHPG